MMGYSAAFRCVRARRAFEESLMRLTTKGRFAVTAMIDPSCWPQSEDTRALRRLRLLHSLPWRTLLLVKLLRKALR